MRSLLLTALLLATFVPAASAQAGVVCESAAVVWACYGNQSPSDTCWDEGSYYSYRAVSAGVDQEAYVHASEGCFHQQYGDYAFRADQATALVGVRGQEVGGQVRPNDHGSTPEGCAPGAGGSFDSGSSFWLVLGGSWRPVLAIWNYCWSTSETHGSGIGASIDGQWVSVIDSQAWEGGGYCRIGGIVMLNIISCEPGNLHPGWLGLP